MRNIRNNMQMTRVRENPPEIRGTTWESVRLTFRLNCMSGFKSRVLFSPAAACPGFAERKGQLQNSIHCSLCRSIVLLNLDHTPIYRNQDIIQIFMMFHICWWSFISVDKLSLLIDVDLKIHTLSRWSIDLHTLSRWFVKYHADD